MNNYTKESVHIPVLLETCVEQMNPMVGERYLDLTAGYGGHAQVFLSKTQSPQTAVLVDRDENAIQTLEPFKEKGARLMHQDFLAAAKLLVEEGQKFDLILADLGVSSPQLDIAERGFSFNKNGPLDMRMDPSAEKTAASIVNHSSKKYLIGILTKFGEEKRGFANRIADAIVAERPKKQIATTEELADIVLSVHKGGWQKTHPATRTFQAIRIAVNDELSQVHEMLKLLPKLLESGGRVGVITFHSLEDRLVKNYFKQDARSGLEAKFEIITKKPLDGATYDAQNPRSRSAKLRVGMRK